MKNEKSYFQSFISGIKIKYIIFQIKFLSGGVAGICAKTVISPIERIKLLYIVNK